MKRQKCQLCKAFTPHFHKKRLEKAPPKTKDGEFVFFPSCGDMAFATLEQTKMCIAYAEKHPSTTFLMQSKEPDWFSQYKFPLNAILGTTIETNLVLFKTPSKYVYYSDISKAPYPVNRAEAMRKLAHTRKAVTVEPILDFGLKVMVEWMEAIRPEIIWVGYDNHKCKLPEPPLAKTEQLIAELRNRGFNVHVKSLRRAWYE